MQTLALSLRQQKILQLLQNQTGFITGQELAHQLGVSPRTVRSDITAINQSLMPLQAQILSVKSKGYRFLAQDSKALAQMPKNDSVFTTREDRVRYLAFQLCLSDIPLNLYDLEDEMSVSHTTLEHDLHQLKRRFVLGEPKIAMNQAPDAVEFAPDEHKRREILNGLFREDWDYDTKGNAYYGYHFLDASILDIIMEQVPRHLRHYEIQMEDTGLVSLNLAVAIMYHRVTSGHPLPSASPIPKHDTLAMYAARDLLDALEHRLHCSFRQEERDSIYLIIASGHLLDASKLSFQTVTRYFGPITIEMADSYLKDIRDTFHLDFSNDEDFYITLLQYIRHLHTPAHTWNTQGNPDIARSSLLVEYEFAHLFQRTALLCLGHCISQADLLYLAYCISGAFEYFYHHHPEYKLRTVICCHLNLTGIWALKRKVLGAFANYIQITALLPVNAGSAYDFQDTDLVLTTVRKEITDASNTDVLRISAFMNPADHRNIEAYIQRKRIQRLYQQEQLDLHALLLNAYWHREETFTSRFSLIQYLAEDFLLNGLVEPEYKTDILRRESILPFAFCPGIVLLYSLEPSSKTQLSVLTLNHRIIWNSHKIRCIVMAALRPEDAPLIFRLLHAFYQEYYDPAAIKPLKDKEAVLDYFGKPPTVSFS